MTRKEKHQPVILTDPSEYIARNEEQDATDIDFLQERAFLSRKYGVSQNRIKIDLHHPVGEICIFIDGKWAGYIDEDLAYCMSNDIDPREYEEEKWKSTDEV